MPYELDLLTRLVSGDLSPASFRLSEQTTHRNFLRHRFTAYVRHFKVQYLGSELGEFTYQRHDEFVFLELNDLPGLPAVPTGPEPRTLGLLLADALPRLSLSLPELQDANCHRVGDQFFLELTAASSFESLPATKARYFYYHTQLLDEAARLHRALPACALLRPDTAAVTRYVQQHQRTLQNLLTHVRQYLEPARRADYYGTPQFYSLAEVHQLMYVELEKLLAYFEQSFPEHLNLTTPLSYRRLIQALADVQTPLAAVLLALHSAEGLPEPLLAPVRECLNCLLITVQDTSLSYQDLLYPRLLLRELHSRLQRGWSLTPENLGRLLLRYNFNAPQFFRLVKDYVRAEAEAAGDQLADQVPVILRYLTRYRQLQPATEVAYVPTLPPLRTQLINWLEAEHEYLSHLVQATNASAPAAASEAARILTPLSVAQMAQLLRTLYDAGVFGQASQRDLFKMLATNFRTARQERISEKSLAANFYNSEEGTRQAVEKLVAKMLQSVRQPTNDQSN
ncbi:hypothetical protein [Hymenobacter sp.]|uniref:hypothetical protein n=1 Tax=Hymenobacter sp. TaxID=1898978 RepID=UPI00286AC287|nr:hypothetical protein [Hymenobacter sp.]